MRVLKCYGENKALYMLINSPQYTGGDYVFVPVCTRQPVAETCSCDNFQQLFGFPSFLAWLLALTYRLPDEILVDFHHDLDLEISRSNMELAASLPKMVWLPRNKKQTHRLNSRPKMWPSDLTWPGPWPWIFKVKYEICYISTKSGLMSTKRKANISSIWTLGLKYDQWVWPWLWPWYLNFQGHMWSWPFGDQGQV